jgi:hypothetical protein
MEGMVRYILKIRPGECLEGAQQLMGKAAAVTVGAIW